MHICILPYVHVTVLYYILASFQKINVNVTSKTFEDFLFPVQEKMEYKDLTFEEFEKAF